MKIVNFGSLNIDHVYSVPHMVKGGETISSTNLATFCGGKGLNQSIAAARAGAEVYHAGMIGLDGAILRECLTENGVHLEYLREVDAPSGHAIIQVDPSGQNCIIITGGTNYGITESYVDEVLKGLSEQDVVLVQNETSCVPYIIKQAHAKKARVVLNPSPITPALVHYPLDLVDLLILNEIEGQMILEDTECAMNDTELLAGLAARFPSAEIVLTLGKSGVWHQKNKVQSHHGIYNVPVVDTTAAGDTFCGYFLAAQAMGLSTEECLRRASIASSIAVSKKGAAASIPHLTDVLAFEPK